MRFPLGAWEIGKLAVGIIILTLVSLLVFVLSYVLDLQILWPGYLLLLLSVWVLRCLIEMGKK